MRILVFSDSHGRYINMKNVIDAYSEIEHIVFCGDGQDDIIQMIKAYPKKNFYCVRGNNDFFAKYPKELLIELEGKKIFITHGDRYYVKSSKEKLVEAAKSRGVDIAIFGHTHIAETFYKEGIHFLNPGSCSYGSPSFATIDIEKNTLFCNVVSCDNFNKK